MFSLTHDPLGSIWLSALVAAIPIVLFLLGLTVLKLKGLHAALLTLVATLVLSFYPFIGLLGRFLAHWLHHHHGDVALPLNRCHRKN